MTTSASPEANQAPAKLVKIRGARKITGSRMLSSLQETAQVTLTRYADATGLINLAKDLKAASQDGTGRVTLNDLLLFLVAGALRKHPEINATIGPDTISQYEHVNLGFAVDSEKSLLVPVIDNCDKLTLSEVAEHSRDLISRCREGRITLDELSGGTFTVSNLGSMGIQWFTPVLNTPQVGILGIGAVHRCASDLPAMLPLSLTFDHQALDGAAAAAALASIARAIEDARQLAGADVLI